MFYFISGVLILETSLADRDPIANLIPQYGADLLPSYSEPVADAAAATVVMSGIDMLRMAVPGTPGDDYPIYAEVPETGFNCEGRVEGGYYADTAALCQPFHICTANGQGGLAKYSFLCPNGTLFNQEYFVCEYWFNVDCSQAESFYVYVKPKNYATHAWHNSIVVWLLGRSSCSSPSTKELHVSGIQ